MNKKLQEIKAGLQEFTINCLYDMHEPDEQGISAEVVGDHLDNAFGTYIHNTGNFSQEFVVSLLDNKNGTRMDVNLADLIALARK